MSIFSKFKKQPPPKVDHEAQLILGKDLDIRLDWLKVTFLNSSDITFHELTTNQVRCGIVYLQGMVDQQLFDEQVLSYVVSDHYASSQSEFIHKLLDLKLVSAISSTIHTDMYKAVQLILDGNIVILVEGDQRMLAFPLTRFEKRAVSEPANENVIRGPREAFIEDINTNLSMIRRRIKTPDLKMDELTIGKYTQTRVVISYIEGICKKELHTEIKERISRIEFDGVLGSSYLEECIDDYPWSPFPLIQKTERPDVVAAALLEGRAAIFVDGSPIPLLAPVNFYMLLQSAEDYYQRYILTSFIRILRFIYLLVSLLFPSLYIAITTFHPEMIPATLLISVAGSRDIVPFPGLVEALLMELAFEGLREAGIRTPKAVGQAIGILGALIIGQAAVQAGIVSAPMVIIVSMTGIASFIIPAFDLSFTIRLLRFPMMILAGTFGIFGLLIGCILTYIHVVHLSSFGVPYLSPTAPLKKGELKDVFVRAPWWLMKQRPSFAGDAGSKRIHIKKSMVEDDED